MGNKINPFMLEKNICAINIGHHIGNFYISDNYPLVYIPICKNASTWATNYFSNVLKWKMQGDDCIKIYNHNAWQIFSALKYHRKIIILRDPIDRWISGIVQYAYTYFPDEYEMNDTMIEYFFSKIYFDHHTFPQVNFIHNLKIKTCDFFIMNEQLEYNINHYLQKNIPLEYQPIPSTLEKNETKNKSTLDNVLYNKLRQIILSDNNYKNKIQQFYKLDYELINGVTFYEAN
jgi:hypothetical protein